MDHQTHRQFGINRIRLGVALLLLLALAIMGNGHDLSAATLDPGNDYSITWQTTQVGGGFSGGGEFSLTGTIGQPDTTQVQGGDFEVNGGYWNQESDNAVVQNQRLFFPFVSQR